MPVALTSSALPSDVNVRTTGDVPLAQVGHWELVRLLGEGTIARVYQARPIGSSRDAPASYAVKLLRKPWQADPRGLEMLAREARAAERAMHPHLISVLAANLVEQPYFVVTPYLPGNSIANLLSQRECPPVPLCLWIARQVAEALEALDDAGWLHGDIKPSNIFVSPTGHATLIDLGLARRRGESHGLASRPVLGTLAYMAPEGLVSSLRVDIRSDIYSLGATLYEMLTGRLPFESSDMTRLVEQHRQELPADLRELAPQLPTRVARLVRQMLAKEPLRRPQTPRELVERLAALEIETFAERFTI